MVICWLNIIGHGHLLAEYNRPWSSVGWPRCAKYWGQWHAASSPMSASAAQHYTPLMHWFALHYNAHRWIKCIIHCTHALNPTLSSSLNNRKMWNWGLVPRPRKQQYKGRFCSDKSFIVFDPIGPQNAPCPNNQAVQMGLDQWPSVL